MGKGPHRPSFLEEKLLSLQDCLASENVRRFSPPYSFILQSIREWNSEAIHAHFESLFGRLRALLDWEAGWCFLPFDSCFRRFLEASGETRLTPLLELQQDIFIDLLSTPRGAESGGATNLDSFLRKVKAQSDFVYREWRALFKLGFWDKLEIQMATPSLSKKATALFNLERLLSVQKLLHKVLALEFEGLGLLANPDFRSFAKLTRLQWSTEAFFQDRWESMLQGFLEECFRDVRADFKYQRRRLRKKLAKVHFSRVEGLLEFGLLLERVRGFFDSRVAEFLQTFQFDQEHSAGVQAKVEALVAEEHRELEDISRSFLGDCWDFLDPVICRFLEYRRLALFQGLFSRTTLKSLVKALAESQFSFSIKDRVIKHFLDELIALKKLEAARPKRADYGIEDFIGQTVYVFSVLVGADARGAKEVLRELFRVKEIFGFLVRLVFPFVKEGLFFESLCARILENKFRLLSAAKCRVSFARPSEERRRRFIQNVRESRAVFHEYLVERAPATQSTLFVSGYLSQNDEHTKESWKALRGFFPAGNLICANWNSASTGSVVGLLKKFGVHSLALLFSPTRATALLGLLGSAKKLYDDKMALFRKTFDVALEEGRLSYQIMKRNRIECDRALNLVSFSLGTVYSFSFLQEACRDEADPLLVKDVFLMGGCLDQARLEGPLAQMLAEDSFFKGTVYIVHSQMDLVLKRLFKLAFWDLSPLGIEGFDHQKCCDSFLQKNFLFFDSSKVQRGQASPRQLMLAYLRKRVKNVDVTKVCGFHTSYRGKLREIFVEIYRQCRLN